MIASEKNLGQAVARGWYLAFCSAAALLITGIPAQAQSAMTNHVRPAVASGQARFVGAMPATESLHLDIVLPLRDKAGLDQFVKELYDPSSPSYRHFLSVSEFTARFGPSQEDYDAVARYAAANGLKVTGGSRDGMELQVEAPVSTIEAAFSVSMGIYQHPTENRTFYSPDREPSAGLPFPLWHISGLDNYSIPHQMLAKKADAADGATARGNKGQNVTPFAVTGSGPSASFLGSDMRAAYYGGTALTGAGENLGLLEYVGTNLADLTTYFTNAHQTNTVPVTLVSVDGTSVNCTAPGCDDTEQTLDMTQAIGMAPGLNSLVMYIGSSDTAIISAMTSHNPLPTTIGCSWGWTPVDPYFLDVYFERMAAQGQNFFAASGDSSTWTKSNGAWPADDPYVVSVGGTDLSTASAGGAWLSETAWADSGGGINTDGIAIPAWQQLAGVINSGNRGSTTLRNGPDVSANANFTFYVCANQKACSANSYGGTSFAAPMWAGYLALVNQQSVANGNTTLGFINPTLYALGVGANYNADFHDISIGTSGSYAAVTGYDLVTGWGSPNAGLLNALATPPTGPNFTISASPSSVTVVQGNSGASTVTTAVSGGLSSAVTLSATGQPSGVTVSFGTNPIAAPGAGTSTVTMAVAATVATGNYTITVTGTTGSIVRTSTVTLTVTGPPAFTISASPTSVSVPQGSSSTNKITTTVSGGFNAAVALTASGQPAGVTVSFSATSIAAPGAGTSTMTMAVASAAATGVYPITVTGTGAGMSNTSTVNLTVTAGPNFTISASPAAVSVIQGSNGSSSITTAVSGGFNSNIALTATGQPTGVTVSFNPNTINKPGSGNSNVSLAVASGTATGVYPITVTGSGAGVTHTATITLTVTPVPAFAISATTPVSVKQGSSGTSTVTTTISNGFNSSVSLSTSGLPGGVSASFSPSSIGVPGAGSSTLTLNAASNANPGTYSVTVSGTGGNATHTTTVSVTITVPPAFTMTASPTSDTITQGSTGASTITTTVSGGFNAAIALSASGLPSGATAAFSQASIAAPGSGTSLVTFTVGTTTATGNYSVTITGTGGGITHTSIITVSVVAPKPPTLTFPSGGSANGKVGQPYNASLVASGGKAPYTFSIISGTLPNGLTLNTSTGAITGTPTVSVNPNLTAKVVDANGLSATASGNINIGH